MKIAPSSLSFDEVGARATLTATVYDANDNVMRPRYWGLLLGKQGSGDRGRALRAGGGAGKRAGHRGRDDDRDGDGQQLIFNQQDLAHSRVAPELEGAGAVR